MKVKSCLLVVLLLSGCAKQQTPPQTKLGKPSKSMLISNGLQQDAYANATKGRYGGIIRSASNNYGVDENLIKAIIQVESGGDPTAVSPSNAIGLMQLKPALAGADVYRHKGRYGMPSVRELQDPHANIDMGANYLNILQTQQLAGIRDPETMRYAMIVSYSNGAGAMLRTFSSSRQLAIEKINRMTPRQFYQYIMRRHPAAQAPRYLNKVNNTYLAMNNRY